MYWNSSFFTGIAPAYESLQEIYHKINTPKICQCVYHLFFLYPFTVSNTACWVDKLVVQCLSFWQPCIKNRRGELCSFPKYQDETATKDGRSNLYDSKITTVDAVLDMKIVYLSFNLMEFFTTWMWLGRVSSKLSRSSVGVSFSSFAGGSCRKIKRKVKALTNDVCCKHRFRLKLGF